MSVFEIFIAVSPFIYNISLFITNLIFKNKNVVINPKYHNYNMALQSCLLLGFVSYDYYIVKTSYNVSYLDFIQISHKGSITHQRGDNAWILYICMLSKLWEWIDTILLIINKKPVITLHWFHHATITWAFYTGWYTSSVYTVGFLNNIIHIIMYLYYAEVKCIKPYAKYLTSLQIIQLFSGVYMNILSYYYNDNYIYKSFSIVNGLLCLSYGIFFIDFFVKKYNKTPKTNEIVEKKTICIGEYEYDITNFKHPGGNVINYMTQGQDATNTFEEFHYRSKKARLVLNSLPKTKIINKDKNTDEEMLNDFVLFRKSLEDRGFFKPSIGHVLYRVFELVFIYGLAVYTFSYNIYASLFLFGIFGGRCGWLQHEGGHNSLTGIIKIDKIIQNIFIGFGLYLDGNMWNSMHNKHHATPQKIGHDIDLDTTPFVAFFDKALDNKYNNIVTKFWLQYQMYSFLPIITLLVNIFWMLYLHPRKIIRDKNITQSIIILFGHFSKIYLFMYLGNVNVYTALLYHIISFCISAIYLFGHFSLSHTFTPVIEKNEDPSWVRYAIEHSVDIQPQNMVVSWIMGYLNCQVIHHLFPSMPQYHGPRVSEELKIFCKKWDIKYTIVSYYDAWYYMFKNLNDVGNKL
jgi:fatty acid desaturase